MHPRRILHVTPYVGGAWAYGGIPRAVEALVAGQVRAGHEVTVCTTDACDERQRLGPVRSGDAPRIEVFPNISNTLAYRLQFFTPRRMAAYLRNHAARFDVAHVHGCHHLLGVVAADILPRADVPYVLSPHGTAPRRERRVLAKWVFDQTLGRHVLPRAAAVLAVSLAEAQQLAQMGVAADKVQLLPNGVDLEEVHAARRRRGELRARLAHSDADVVLFLGRWTGQKRVELLLRAFARMERPRAHLVLAGGDADAIVAMRSRVKELKLTGRVTAMGVLAREERLVALGDADVVVYPSVGEVFGLVALEAILMGTPVLTSGDSGCGALVRQLEGGRVFDEPTPEHMAVLLAEMLDARSRVGAAAKRAELLFSAEAVAEQSLRVYAALERARAPNAAEREGDSVQDVTAPRPTRGMSEPVSVVIPVRNAGPALLQVLEAAIAEVKDPTSELIVVDDGSTDHSRAVLDGYVRQGRIRVVEGSGKGAAAALNRGFAEARHPVIVQLDQDVIIQSGAVDALLELLHRAPDIAAVQGRYQHAPGASVWARVMALDLELRYAQMATDFPDHVCTGNTVYRAEAVRSVGGFDERLGYGYDNDLSYRLRRAGFRLGFRRDARSVHLWRETFAGYLGQQYGVGYGRLDLVRKHPQRVAGDQVSNAWMIAHAPLMTIALLTGPWSALAPDGAQGRWIAPVAWLALVLERSWAALRAWRTFRSADAWLFPIVHLARDVTWVVASARWLVDQLLGRTGRPANSMRPGMREGPTVRAR